MKEARYRVTVKFMPGKGEGLDPRFEFWINEDPKLHPTLITKMLEAAACERWGVPIVSTQWTGEDFLSIVKTFKVSQLGREQYNV